MDTQVVESLIIKQGAFWSRAWPITDEVTDLPQDLTGWTAAAKVRGTASGTLLADLAPTTSGSSVVITVSAATSLTWTWTHGVFDLLLTDDAGVTYQVVGGTVTLRPAVTHAD